MPSLFVIDDHRSVLSVVTAIVDTLPGITLAGTATTAEEGLIALETLKPDVVLLDVNLPGMSGIDAAPLILAMRPASMVWLMSTCTFDDLAIDLIETGATGFLYKAELSREVLGSAVGERRV